LYHFTFCNKLSAHLLSFAFALTQENLTLFAKHKKNVT
jgi:hypothetical protein